MNKINQGIILFKMNRSLLSDYFSENQTKTEFRNCDSWVILSPIEQSIKRKIEEVGTPLKDWDINIFRGILTGYNEAFIISGEKRTELLAACGTEKERIRTDELIRPILRGRDIKRYTYEFADLYIIATFPAKHYNIDDYPAIKAHLLSYGIERLEQTGKEYTINGEKIKARKKTNNQWFETQDSISYWDDFSKQKIIWAELARTGNAFTYDDSGAVVLNTCYILTFNNEDQSYIKNLLAILNSKLILFYMNLISSKLDKTGWRWLKQFVELLPIPDKIAFADSLISCVDDTLSLKKNDLTFQNEEEKINNIVYNTYGLTEEEIFLVDSFIKDISSSVK